MAARRVREQLSPVPEGQESGRLKIVSSELKNLNEGELRQHFWDEERILGIFEDRMGTGDPDVERIRKDHRLLESLLLLNTRESLLQFADTLVGHIRFEEDIFFGRLEKALDETRRLIVSEILPKTPNL
jgi:hypothetical protein